MILYLLNILIYKFTCITSINQSNLYITLSYINCIQIQFKKKMEEEQEDFAHDLANLQSDVGKLKELVKLSGAVKNAETVRRIKQALINADERSKLFNSRENLFNVTETEYFELNEIFKLFEPFYDLWDSAEKWLSHKEAWTNGPFVDLDAEAVQGTVTVLLKNLAKSAKTFEKLNLSQVNVIAAQVLLNSLFLFCYFYF